MADTPDPSSVRVEPTYPSERSDEPVVREIVRRLLSGRMFRGAHGERVSQKLIAQLLPDTRICADVTVELEDGSKVFGVLTIENRAVRFSRLSVH